MVFGPALYSHIYICNPHCPYRNVVLDSNFACAEMDTLVMDADMSTPRLTNCERTKNRRAEDARDQRLARDRARRRQRLALETAEERETPPFSTPCSVCNPNIAGKRGTPPAAEDNCATGKSNGDA